MNDTSRVNLSISHSVVSTHSVFNQSVETPTLSSNRRQPSISLPIYRLFSVLLYPTAIFLGQALLVFSGQNALLASAPPLLYFISIAMCSAMISAPFLLLFNGLLDRNVSEHNLLGNLGHGLLYVANLIANIKLTTYLAATVGHHMMSAYTIYAIYGAGMVPALLCGLAVAAGVRYINLHTTSVVESTPIDLPPSPDSLVSTEADYNSINLI